jgi:hypothetical protein
MESLLVAACKPQYLHLEVSGVILITIQHKTAAATTVISNKMEG